MKATLAIAITIVSLLFAGLLIGPSFMDWDKYKPQIIEQAKSSTGYDVHIDGDIAFSILPTPRLKLQGLSVDAPRGKEKKLISVQEAFVSVNLLPLLSGNVEVDTVRLEKPIINLEKLSDGSVSWLAEMTQKETPKNSSNDNNKFETSRSLSLDKIIINKGQISYKDFGTGASHVAKDINLNVSAQSLQGPFFVDGDLIYNDRMLKIGLKTKKIDNKTNDIDADVIVSLPQDGASASFKGVISLDPMEVQGKVTANAKNLGAAIVGVRGEPVDALAQAFSFSGLVTANDNQVRTQEVDITLGDTSGSGNITLSNLKDQNPVKLNADVALKGILNLDKIAKNTDKSKQSSVEERLAKGQKLSPTKGILPETLSLPFPLDAEISLVVDGVQSSGQVYKGITAQIQKTSANIDFSSKVLEIAGKSNADLRGSVKYASTSKTGDKGVVYADPTMLFSLNGNIGQLPTLLRSMAGNQKENAAFEIYKTAAVNVQGSISRDKVSFTNSTIKLDETTLYLNGSYRGNGGAGMPDVVVDVSTDTIDIDNIQLRLKGQNKQAVQTQAKTAPDVKKALEPVRGISVPMNLTFDVSAQKAKYNGQDIKGIRIKGNASGSALKLDVASAQDYLGAAASLKGSVADLKALSGIDLSFYGKTSNLKSLMQSFKIDTSKLPDSISAAEANISAKGQAENLSFNADVAALNGKLKASGIMTGLTDKPSFDNLSIGASHPNLVKAVQIMNPSFTGGAGLEKPFSFDAKAIKNGNSYDLSGMNAALGSVKIGGDVSIDNSGTKPSIKASLQAGDIALDDLLGAKTSPQSSGNASSSSASSGGGKWSKAPLETGWMHSMNMNLNLSAKSITYGGWNFVAPSTQIDLKDGALNVQDLKAGLFGGNALLNARVNDPVDPKQPLSLAIQTKMDNVNLEPLVTALSGTRRLKANGNVSFDMDIQGSGLSSHAIVSSLQGKSSLNGNDVVFKGFDLAQIGLALVDSGKPLDRLSSIVGGATSGGETRFDTIKGQYNIAQGIATISSMEMDGPSANILSKGNVNLPQWFIDTVHTLTFKQAREAGSFDVVIKGPLDNPANTFGKGLFNDVLTRRLQEKAIEKLPDVLGKDLTGKLQGLGILPPAKQQPTPQTPTNEAPIDPAPQTEPATAPAPTPQPTPQQLLEDEAGKAIKGVLDGLLQ